MRFQLIALPLLAAALAATPACKVRYRRDVEPAGTPAKYTYSAGGYIRYDGYDDVAGDLEIASRDFVKPGSGARIRLAGVIHIGDVEYYRTLQKELLDTADVVLFEGVKYEGTTPPDLGGAYKAIGEILGTGFQKDGIDYGAKNFVHCDVTVKPGDKLAQTIDPSMMAQAQMAVSMMSSMKAALAPGKAGKEVEDAIKHNMVGAMAAQMGGVGGEEGGSGIDGALDKVPDEFRGSVERLKKLAPTLPEIPGFGSDMMKEILDKRNDHVVEALRARLDTDGDKPQTIAVFYGAAHMPGIEKDLRAMGFEPAETMWLRAWRINSAGGEIVAGREGVAPQRKQTDAARPPARRREPALY